MYKIVTRYKLYEESKDRLRSFNRPFDEYAVDYKENEWTYPKIGKLFVFRSLENVNRFLSSIVFCSGHEIWECEIGTCDTINSMIMGSSDLFPSFWNNTILGDSCYVPVGTIVTDKVKLTKKIS